MTDPQLRNVFAQSWEGLRVKYAGDPARFQRVGDRYVNRLEHAHDGATARGVIAELCAEGGISVGGLDDISDEASFLEFWRELNQDWKKCRLLTLLARFSRRG